MFALIYALALFKYIFTTTEKDDLIPYCQWAVTRSFIKCVDELKPLTKSCSYSMSKYIKHPIFEESIKIMEPYRAQGDAFVFYVKASFEYKEKIQNFNMTLIRRYYIDSEKYQLLTFNKFDRDTYKVIPEYGYSNMDEKIYLKFVKSVEFLFGKSIEELSNGYFSKIQYDDIH